MDRGLVTAALAQGELLPVDLELRAPGASDVRTTVRLQVLSPIGASWVGRSFRLGEERPERCKTRDNKGLLERIISHPRKTSRTSRDLITRPTYAGLDVAPQEHPGLFGLQSSRVASARR